jgi:aryl sulfotransferase
LGFARPMTVSSGIIWLASFPKSGDTWFRILLANLTAGESGPSDINNLGERGGIASSRHEFEAATMLDSGLLSHDDIDCLRPRVYEAIAAEASEQRWIEVHDAYTTIPGGEPLFGRNIARAAVYLVRDPRDVAVSLAYHNSTTIDHAISLMNAADSALCRGRKGLSPQLRQKLTGWSGHVTSWLDQTDVPAHTARYEDLFAAPAECFAGALKFAGRSVTPSEIERAVRHADFTELQRQESDKGFAERISRQEPFFRSGRVGDSREALTIAQADAIEQCHGAVMARLGYGVEKG